MRPEVAEHRTSSYGVFDAERGAAVRGSFLVDREGVLRWQVVNGIGEARTLGDYRVVLGDPIA